MADQKRFSVRFFPVVLLVMAVPVFFYRVLLSGEPLFGSDFVLQFFPWKQFIYESIRTHGALPFWNPYVLSGTPFIGNIQTSMFYPMGILFYLMPPDQAYGFTIMLHFALGAVFMYAFTRSISLDRKSASFAAIIFTSNGYLVGHLYAGHLTFVQNYIWIPLLFLCLTKFCGSLNLRFAALGGLCLGTQILGGFPQIAFYSILSTVLFAAWQAVLFLKEGAGKKVARLAAGTALLLSIGFGLAAVQLLPTYEFTQLSGRSGGVSYEFATSDSFDPVNFITFVMPNFFGNATNRTYWKSEEIWQFWELCAYTGIGPLLLIGFIRRDGPARRIWSFFGVLMALALLLSLGRHNPLYRFVYHLPGFSHFRIPAQILYLYVFAVAVMAAAGFNGLTRLKSYPMVYKVISWGGLLFLGGLAILFFLFPTHFFNVLFRIVPPHGLTPDSFETLYETLRLSILTTSSFFLLITLLIHWRVKNRIGTTLFTVTLFIVAVVDLWSFTNPMIQTTNLGLSPEKTKLISNLADDREMFRVVTAGDFLKPNDALLYGYQNIEGYDPLILKRYLDYINKSQNTPQFSEAVHIFYVTRLDNNLIRMLNLKYAVLSNGQTLKLDDTLPRAALVPRAITAPAEKTLDHIMGADFDPRQVVVLAPDDEKFMPSEGPREDFAGSCIISDYAPETIRILTSANEAGYLVLSEIFYPGWEAFVDGEEASVLRGNYLFRVLPLDKGNHEIEFRFVSWPFRLGLTVSLLTLSGSLSFVFWRLRKERAQKEAKVRGGSSPQKYPLRISIEIRHTDGRITSAQPSGKDNDRKD